MPMSIPSVALCAAVLALGSSQAEELALRPLFTFDDARSVAGWRPSHDTVMGGVSSGRAGWEDGVARFTGEVSLENNGGFASFRTRLAEPLDLSKADGIQLRVRGDGKNWRLRVDAGARRGPNWQAPFQVGRGDAWQTVVIPFEAFVPSFRGRYVRDAGPLDRSAITLLGVQIADGQEGDFELEVDAIEAWSVRRENARAGSIGAHVARTETLAVRLAESPAADALLETTGWSERLLVVAEPLSRGNLGKPSSLQRGRFVASLEELAARDLRVVHLLGDRATLVGGQELGRDATRALRARWKLDVDEWGCALVGKDGGVKERWSAPIDPEDAFALIDRMPMRRAERRERAVGH